ncbi:MAG: serine hydrolase domain-containing protein [Candidatus Eiseniibacteriota bacterium]
MMRRGWLLAVAIGLWLTSTGTPPLFAEAVSFPDTAPGAHARAWFAAYDAGESEMRAFWEAHGDAASLTERPVDARLEVWRGARGRTGSLTALRVQGSGPDFIDVLAHSANGDQLSVHFQCAAAEPHGLMGIMLQPADENVGHGPADSGPPAGPPPTDAEMVSRMRAQVDSLASAGEFSGVALLEKNGAPLYQHAVGLASREKKIANQMDTRFNLGSINKIFTHVAILQLAEHGKLSLDSTIDHYIASYPSANASRITVRQLLDHKGGVPDVFGPGYSDERARTLRTVNDWYALVRDQPLQFDPGTRQEYSNGGYVLLGAIIESVSGENYYDYVRRHIYEPAGMTRTEHLLADESRPERATSYTRMAEGLGHEPPSPGASLVPAALPERGSPAGGGYSTAPDMAKFARALREGKLVSAKYAPQMVGESAALGIAGGSPGVNALLQLNGPYTVVVLANLDPPAAEQFMTSVGRMLRATSPRGGAAPPHMIGAAGGH